MNTFAIKATLSTGREIVFPYKYHSLAVAGREIAGEYFWDIVASDLGTNDVSENEIVKIEIIRQP